MSPQELQQRLDLLLDGELSEEEAIAFSQTVQDDPGLRDLVRDHLVLSSALESVSPSAFAPEVLPPFRWWPRVAATAAAAVLVAAAFLFGRTLSDAADGADSRPVVPVARAGDVIDASGSLREVRVGDARLRVRPGGRISVVSEVPAAVALELGSVEVASASADARVDVEGFGKAFVQGDAALLLGPDTSRRGGYLMVTSFAGAVRVVDGEFTDGIEPGEPRLFDGGGPRLAGEVLARMSELEGDEGLMVLTTSQHTELMAALDQDKEQLQVRVADLLAANERLALEFEAMQRRDPKRKLSLREVLDSMAAIAERDGISSRTQASQWRRIRAVVRKYDRRPDEVVGAIEEILLAADATPVRRRLGMWCLSRVRSSRAIDMLMPYVDAPNLDLRVAAIEGLARQRNARCRDALSNAFQHDEALLARISAAGGLVSLGDYGAPLEWLLEEYRKRPRHPEHLRRRMLGRVAAAPLAQSKVADYIVDLCVSREAAPEQQREVIHLLARLGDDTARTTLEFLSEAAARPPLRALAARYLGRLDKEDR